jgi:hypothetical protein
MPLLPTQPVSKSTHTEIKICASVVSLLAESGWLSEREPRLIRLFHQCNFSVLKLFYLDILSHSRSHHRIRIILVVECYLKLLTKSFSTPAICLFEIC